MSMSDLREYKCPACGGAIEFDSKSQKMKCPYCDTEFELETLKELDAQMGVKPDSRMICQDGRQMPVENGRKVRQME